MAKLFHAPASPYSAKVRMAALHTGMPIEKVQVDTASDPAELIAANPLGKIPTLITDEGEAVFDSSAIMQHINRVTGNKLYPRAPAKRLEAERLEALADGLCDALLAHVYERRFRPEEKVHLPWLERQWSKAIRTLDHLNASPPKLTKNPTGGQIAVRAALAYASLRFGGQWERGRSKLTRWAKRFDERFPEMAAELPRA
jgi:glutathione S-transferase